MSINFIANGSQKISGILGGIIFHDLIGAPEGEPEAEHGRFEPQIDGGYSYIPKAGFFGIETLTFSDGQTMTLLVGPPAGQGLKNVVEGINSIGTIVSDFGIYDGAEDSNLYNLELNEIDNREFNHFTLENNGKWSLMGEAVDLNEDGFEWEYQYHESRIEQLVRIADHVKNDLGSKINLHTLLWDQEGHQAQNIINRVNAEIEIDATLPTAQEVFETSVENHLEVLLGALGNSIDLIDVVNEHVYADHISNGGGIYTKVYDDPTGYIKFGFAETQRAIDKYNFDRPESEQIDARLAINDFNVLYQFDDNKYDDALDTPDVKADLYYNLVKELIEDGVQIDVVGFQSHLSVDRMYSHIGQNTDDNDLNNNVPPTGEEIYDAILSNLQKFIELGVEIVISELDVRTHLNDYDANGDVDLEASDFNMIYEVIGALAHDIPEITDVTLWGTAHHVSWLSEVENDPLLFNGNSDDGYSREAEYYAFMEGLTGNSQYNRTDEPISNSEPIAVNDDGYTVALYGQTIIDVLDNDSDPDGDALTVTHINGVEFEENGWTSYINGVGLIQLNEDGTLTHHSLDSPRGDFSFSYTVSDGQGGAAVAFVNGTIGAGPLVNSAPIAVNDDGYSVASYGQTTIDVLANDSDPDGDELTVTHINGVEIYANGWTDYINGVGLIQRNEDGTLTHHSLDSHQGDFSFSYTVNDGQGGEAVAFVSGAIEGGESGEIVYGTAGDDHLDGTDFDDELHGYEGVDVFYGSSGDDVIYGRAPGGDEYNQVNYLGEGVSSSDFTFTRNVEDGVESVIATSEKFGQDTLYGIDGIYFEEDGWKAVEDLPGIVSTTQYGTAGDDSFDGTDFADELYGYEGFDIFYGSAGDDLIFGQTWGSDEYNQVNYLGEGVSLSDFTFTLNLEDGVESIIATSEQFGQDTLHGIGGIYFEEDGWVPIEDLPGVSGITVNGTAGDDSLDGTSFSDKLYGHEGYDIFYGSSGDDLIFGQAPGGDEYNQINYLGEGVSSSDFTFTLNLEDGVESVIATSDKFGQDTLHGIGGVYFEEDGWKPIEDLYIADLQALSG